MIRSWAPGRTEQEGKCWACRADCFARKSAVERGSWAQAWNILLAWIVVTLVCLDWFSIYIGIYIPAR